MKLVIKLLTVAIAIQSYAIASQASCEIHEKAVKVLSIMKSEQVQSKWNQEQINEVAAHIDGGSTLCTGGDQLTNFLNGLMGIQLCRALSEASSLMLPANNILQTKNPSKQVELEKALLAYGKLFNSNEEQPNGFGGCDLKLLTFTALEKK